MQAFPNSGKEWEGGKFSPVEWQFYWEGIFLLGEGNLRVGDFDNSNLFQS